VFVAAVGLADLIDIARQAERREQWQWREQRRQRQNHANKERPPERQD